MGVDPRLLTCGKWEVLSRNETEVIHRKPRCVGCADATSAAGLSVEQGCLATPCPPCAMTYICERATAGAEYRTCLDERQCAASRRYSP
eukprot:2084608-Amphidinium_carterae.1